MDKKPTRDVALMFSGGRDSSLVACLYALQGDTPHLLSFKTGLGINGDGLREMRVAELRDRFPGQIDNWSTLPAFGLVRKIATCDLENDFRTFAGKNLILLGEKLALHACSLAYCLKNGIKVVADGSSGYQTYLPEQRPVALSFFHKLSERYGVTFETPVADVRSEDEVKYALLELGLSTKSLEGTSMFADSFSEASDSTIAAYLRRKEVLVDEYLQLVLEGKLPTRLSLGEELSA